MHNLSMQERMQNVTLHGQLVQIMFICFHLFSASTAQAVQFLLGTARQWIPLCAGTLVQSQDQGSGVSDLAGLDIFRH